MWWAPLIGAVAGAVMANKQQKAADQARKDQALINMYAPLFGQQVQALPARQDLTTQGAVSGGMTGYQIGQGLEDQKLRKTYYDAMIADKANTANPYASTLVPAPSSIQSVPQKPWAPVSAENYFNMYGRE
jgi:hypothetical protein